MTFSLVQPRVRPQRPDAIENKRATEALNLLLLVLLSALLQWLLTMAG
jgi:hypothetical protein